MPLGVFVVGGMYSFHPAQKPLHPPVIKTFFLEEVGMSSDTPVELRWFVLRCRCGLELERKGMWFVCRRCGRVGRALFARSGKLRAVRWLLVRVVGLVTAAISLQAEEAAWASARLG